MTVAYQPRYTAVSVTGWAINPAKMSAARNASKATPASFWYVLDRANCHQIVASFDWYGANKQGRAEARAAELNAAEDAWLAERGIA